MQIMTRDFDPGIFAIGGGNLETDGLSSLLYYYYFIIIIMTLNNQYSLI